MSDTEKFTIIVNKWRVLPAPAGWEFLREHTVTGKVTPKRIVVTDGLYKGKKFDRSTGREIARNSGFSWYSLSLKITKEQAA